MRRFDVGGNENKRELPLATLVRGSLNHVGCIAAVTRPQQPLSTSVGNS